MRAAESFSDDLINLHTSLLLNDGSTNPSVLASTHLAFCSVVTHGYGTNVLNHLTITIASIIASTILRLYYYSSSNATACLF